MDSWDREDGFFYDVLHTPDDQRTSMKVRSMVGLVPLFAVETLEPEDLERMPGFSRRMKWFVENRTDLTNEVACIVTPGQQERRLLALVGQEKPRTILPLILDEPEFPSPPRPPPPSLAPRPHPFPPPPAVT